MRRGDGGTVARGLGEILAGDEDVVGLEVAMDDAVLVRVLEGVAHAGEEREAVTDGEGRAGGCGVAEAKAMRLGPSTYSRARKGWRMTTTSPRASVTLISAEPGLVDLGDPRVAESREDAGLVLESPGDLTGGEGGAEELEGHGAARMILLGQVHHPEPPFAQWAEDAVGGDAVGGVPGATSPKAASAAPRTALENAGAGSTPPAS